MGEVTGYEIHMGVTEPGTDREAFCGDGRVSEDGLVFGTYMHGLFLNPSAANALLSFLSAKKGLPFTPIPSESADPYESLACVFEKYVNMEAIIHFLRRNNPGRCRQSRDEPTGPLPSIHRFRRFPLLFPHPMRLVMLWNPSLCPSAHRTACTAERSTSPVTLHFTQ